MDTLILRMAKVIREYIDLERTYNCDNTCKCETCEEAHKLLEELRLSTPKTMTWR